MEITIEHLENELKDILPEDRVVINTTVRELHSKDESYHASSLPDVVVFPKTTEEVSAIMKVAGQQGTAVVPLAFVAAMPPNVASAPGSTLKNRPYFFNSLLS